jgi:hypothetical protein
MMSYKTFFTHSCNRIKYKEDMFFIEKIILISHMCILIYTTTSLGATIASYITNCA